MKLTLASLLLACFVSLHPLDIGAGQTDQATGRVWTASAQDARRSVTAAGELVVPSTAGPLRGAIVVIRWGLGGRVYKDQAWRQLADDLRFGLVIVGITSSSPDAKSVAVEDDPVRNAAAGGGEALTAFLADLARRSNHPELERVPLLFWGHSAAGSFGATFAGLHPDRSIAFIRYHSNLRGLPLQIDVLGRIPALIFAGGADTTAGVEDGEALWKAGRALRAPWTFALEPGATHGSAAALEAANALALPWVRAVVERRLASDGMSLRTIDEGSGWLASDGAAEVAPASSFLGVKADANWLPDQASVQGWRLVSGFPPK